MISSTRWTIVWYGCNTAFLQFCTSRVSIALIHLYLSYIHYRQKIWNIFCFSDFLHICGVCRVFLSLKYIHTSRYYFLGSELAFNSKMKRKGSKPNISALCSIRLWLEFFLSLYQIAAISIRALYRNLVHNTIVFLPPILCGQQGISVVGASHNRTWGIVLIYHQGMYTKS